LTIKQNFILTICVKPVIKHSLYSHTKLSYRTIVICINMLVKGTDLQ